MKKLPQITDRSDSNLENVGKLFLKKLEPVKSQPKMQWDFSEDNGTPVQKQQITPATVVPIIPKPQPQAAHLPLQSGTSSVRPQSKVLFDDDGLFDDLDEDA